MFFLLLELSLYILIHWENGLLCIFKCFILACFRSLNRFVRCQSYYLLMKPLILLFQLFKLSVLLFIHLNFLSRCQTLVAKFRYLILQFIQLCKNFNIFFYVLVIESFHAEEILIKTLKLMILFLIAQFIKTVRLKIVPLRKFTYLFFNFL